MGFRLGPWVVEPERNAIVRDGAEARVTPKAMDLLAFLARRPGDVVSRDDILREVWEGVAVTDDAIIRCIGELRRALQDDARNPRILETISRRGYRIVAPVDWSPVAGADPPTPPLRRRRVPALAFLAPAVLGVTVLAGAALALHFILRPLPSVRSVAVLPLDDHSEDRQEYFAEGMTEALITELAQIRSLRVISRTSAMRYRGSGKAVPEIARELSVDAVVEGSVLRSGTRVRITAQLIHAATDSHLWSGSFERNLGDIVSLQDEIARAIAAQLEITLTATEEERLRRGRPVAPDAYDAFLIGQYFVSRGQYGKGADAFEEATKKDPSFALAHAMLCEADSMVTHGLEQPARERALRAMETARKLDDSLAEVHMIVGDKLFYEDWDWAAGEAEFRRAVKIDPGSVQAAMHYMFCLHAQTRWDEAIREGRRALHLDPASPRLNTQWINLLRHSGRHDEALAAFHKLLRLGPDVPGERNRGLANIYQGMGREDEAISALLKADASLSVPPAELDKREAAARTGGLRGYWNAVLQSQPRQSPLRPVALALLHVQAGRNEEALDWLETAFRQRSPRLAWLKAYSGFDPLRSHPRFRALVRQMRLPP